MTTAKPNRIRRDLKPNRIRRDLIGMMATFLALRVIAVAMAKRDLALSLSALGVLATLHTSIAVRGGYGMARIRRSASAKRDTDINPQSWVRGGP